MGILEVLQHIVISILIGYLAFTDFLATQIIKLLPEHEPTIEEIAVVPTDAQTDFEKLDSRYEFGSILPRILIENAEFQQAAVGASGDAGKTKEDPIPVGEKINRALVNIFCQHKTDAYIRTTTGTGYFISTKGVVLTNAHVAQFLLLEGAEEKVSESECVIRGGDPARPLYKAELLYISPAWVHENANLISEAAPRGTGERDYALLYISEGYGSKKLPASFPALKIDTAPFTREMDGIRAHAGGYPAGLLFENGADAKLRQQIATTSITEIYTFGSNQADLFSIAASSVGEQGSSGGPVTRSNGRAIGLIVTRGDENTEHGSSLRALTLEYINRTIKEETGYSLAENMQGNLAFRSSVFKRALAPFLTELLTDEIE